VISVDELRPLPVFHGLSDAQLEQLLAGSGECLVRPGIELFHEGAPADVWWVLLDGAIGLSRRVGREDVVVAHMDEPGRWAGGFRAWDEHGVYLATGRGAADGRVLCVPVDVLRTCAEEWLPLAGHLIRGLFNTARSIESTARQRDALVTLGTLSAGLAHEINNPASAATRAVDSLEGAAQTLMSALRTLADEHMTAAQFAALDDLRLATAAPAPLLDALGRADREQELSAWLETHRVEQAWTLAPALTVAGVDVAWCERVAAAVDADALPAALEWVASASAARGLLGELKESTRRISELVAAVRSYSQMDRASMQRVDVTDGLESTLVMLGHRIPSEVAVVRDYAADVPELEAYPGELNQVWTNLITNALDAMEDAGTLRVATRLEGGRDANAGAWVVIEIGDTGEGLPPEVAVRAFEAFYTTKDVGKGTGLGLDIARRIVTDRHGGEIAIESGPPETVARVRLPLGRSGA
jgi:signal transduction histidine kinase